MKFKFRRLTIALAIMLTTVLMLNSIGATAVTKDAHADMSYKLDKPLLERLAQMGDDDEIDVSIWVEDVDHKAVKEEAREEILKLAEAGEVSTDVLILLDEVESYAELEAQGAKEPTQEDTQTLIELKRAIYRRVYNEKNTQIYKELFKDTRDSDKPEPGYLGSYAPNMTMKLTKTQVLDICESDLVTQIFEDNDPNFINIPTDINISNKSSIYDNFNKYKDDTGVTSMQAYNEGAYINIGVLEVDGIPYTNLSCFSTAMNEGRITKLANMTTDADATEHAGMVLAIMTGETSDFHGVACDARYICTRINNHTSAKAASEALISNGANILNMSFETIAVGTSYGNFSKWLDHMAFYHNVHVCKGSGNTDTDTESNPDADPTTNIHQCSMAYNAIVVGATSISGNGYCWANYSRYNHNSSLQVKPDIVAPGTDIATPVCVLPRTGTSLSTPLVSGSLAMLLRSNSYMLYNPQFAKAALLAGCKNLVKLSSQNSNSSNQIAANQKTGAGMMHVYQSKLATNGFSMCDVGTCSSGNAINITKSFNVTSSQISAGKKVRAAFCYNVKATLSNQNNHSTSSVSTPTINHTVMTITTPGGTIYRSNYYNDNKQIICFTPVQSGAYIMQITGETCTDPQDFAYVISVHNATVSY
ncbi:MAG: S8/S53 family peptidase [Clostridiales bacterium]|nr:S8/S53 family peptidase [Clostridiales bacterium]